jgi:hypothetical protein
MGIWVLGDSIREITPQVRYASVKVQMSLKNLSPPSLSAMVKDVKDPSKTLILQNPPRGHPRQRHHLNLSFSVGGKFGVKFKLVTAAQF